MSDRPMTVTRSARIPADLAAKIEATAARESKTVSIYRKIKNSFLVGPDTNRA